MGKGSLRRQKKRWGQQCARLERELGESRCLLQQAYAGFNGVSDPDLVESWIYEINALEAQYSYLLKMRKAMEAGELGADGP